MNVTELARILKVSPQELREMLPQVGYDIGFKAIKIDYHIAKKIIKEWPNLIRQIKRNNERKEKEAAADMSLDISKKEVFIPNFITVREFSAISGVPVNKILAELMKNSIFASLNEKIDFETAMIVGEDLGLEVKLNESNEDEKEAVNISSKIKESLKDKESFVYRPPVIVVMGHVDHGKTKLLDKIRSTDVAGKEAGGITQHIGAYQINHNDKKITFIDTPGHEAFTAMRNRGAKVADIAILVVAADDGVKPQTIEAYRIIEAAKIPFVVAINKIDKPDANIDKTKQDLASYLNIIPEDWGGKTVCVPVSAINGQGIKELLDIILLTVDLEPDNLKADPSSPAIGTIIESKMDKGEGVVATILVQNGTLRVGQDLYFNDNYCGKVRALKNYLAETVESVGPSGPARIFGFKIAPSVGDIIEVCPDNKCKNKIKKTKSNLLKEKNATSKNESYDETAEKINLIIRSDTLGSGEAIEGSLSKIDTGGVVINILSKGLGNVTEGDILKAEASNADVIGFNVKISPVITDLARNKKVSIKSYKIIYDLLNELKEKIQFLIKPDIKRVDIGSAKVLASFRKERKEQIIGCKILDGQIKNNVLVELERNGQIIDSGKITQVKIGVSEVDLVEKNEECGVKYEGDPIIEINDVLRFYINEEIYKKVK